jgi:multimeric flavodoxin WrbA
MALEKVDAMPNNGNIIGIVGSPNKDGRTNQLVSAALEGVKRAGREVELIQMSDHVVTACKDCQPWVCRNDLKCTFEDEAFLYLSEKVLNADGLILGSPVYWWDTSGMVKYFILKMFRVYAPSAPLNGLPALGLAIAGGTGNGLVTGLRPVYHFFQIMQMRAIEPVPATRFNFSECLKQSGVLGEQIAVMSRERKRFENREEILDLYDRLPYLSLTRAGERRLLAGVVTRATADGCDPSVPSGLATADELSATHRSLEALIEIGKVYETGIEAYNKK